MLTMKYAMTNECHSYECGQQSANHYMKYIALIFYDFGQASRTIADMCVHI